MLGPSPPSMEKAGSNVQLTITSLWLKLSDLDSGEVICFDTYSNLYSKIMKIVNEFMYKFIEKEF